MGESDLDNQDLTSGFSFPDMFSMRPDQEDDFRRQVQLAGKKIRILIHPFYYSRTEKLQRYYPILERVLKSDSSVTAPVVIF